MDIETGKNTITKNMRPRWTVWRKSTITKHKRMHNKRARRTYRQYLLTGDVRQFARSQKLLTSWDFD